MPSFSTTLEQSIHGALALANARKHELATLEHLLLSLIDEPDAARVLQACAVNLVELRKELTDFIEDDLSTLITDVEGSEAVPTAAFQRVIQRAAIHVQSSGRTEVTGANVLVAIFAERESNAAYFLQEQDMTRYDAVNFIAHGVAKDPAFGESRPVTGAPDGEAADDAEQRRERDLFRRFVVASAFALAVMVISMVRPLRFAGWEWVAGALTVPVVFWSGLPFHRGALVNLRHRSTNMDTLVSMGTLSAFTWSTVVLVGDIDGTHVYFETAAVIITLILLGKWFEVKAKRRSGDAIRALAELGAPIATLEDGREIDIADLAVGDRFIVKPGAKIATDGGSLTALLRSTWQ